jgi:hypothetical protein
METLDTEWDLGREEAEELEWRTRQAFDALDRTELFAWFAATKGATDARIQAWLESIPGKCEAAERFIADRPDLFICLATELAAVIASSRPGLEEADLRLWETLGKHRRIEEVRDEVELAPSHHDVLIGVAESVQKPPINTGKNVPPLSTEEPEPSSRRKFPQLDPTRERELRRRAEQFRLTASRGSAVGNRSGEDGDEIATATAGSPAAE